MSMDGSTDLDEVLDFIKRHRGFDFTGYKRSSLERRITKRMHEVGCATYADYLDHLELHQDEFAALFDTILINVTGFFRDPTAWEYVRAEVLPDLIAAKAGGDPLRVWCAGCATGQEAYTVAMVMADAVGEDAYRERVKIYATDADEQALQVARQATYAAKEVEPIPPADLDRYFTRSEGQFTLRPDFRRTVIFGRNDLVQDAPISRIDLLLCRNTLMYFNAETQARILRRFHFALEPGGVLMLGRSEMLISHADRFTPLDLKRRVYAKVIDADDRQTRAVREHTALEPAQDIGGDASLRVIAFDASPVAQVVVDASGTLISVNQAARRLFGVSIGDVGRPLSDLELSYRPLELRSHLDRLRSDPRGISVEGATWTPRGGAEGLERVLNVEITPLVIDGVLRGASIAYTDTTRTQHLHEELETSKRALEDAYEELQSTVEELETTNEELQSTNEELETTNEELQSTNEELETMNEELRFTNEELEAINDELRARTAALDQANAFVDTILASVAVAIVVLDHEQVVRIWNRRAEHLWGLRTEEVTGRALTDLDIGLPLLDVGKGVQSVLEGAGERTELVLDATNRRGSSIRCRVTSLPLIGDGAVSGALLLMQELDGVPDGDGRPNGDGRPDGDGRPGA